MAYASQPRLYVEDRLIRDCVLLLSANQSHYLSHVLRLTQGGDVLLFNGLDGEWRFRVAGTKKKAIELECLEQTKNQDELPDLMLAFAPIKRARIDFIAEKATELGVGIIQPVLTEFTQVARVNTKRLLANAIEAAEQTERLTIPEIREPMKLTSFLSSFSTERHLIFCDENCGGMVNHAMTQAVTGLNGPATILIGPEGGFSESERTLIKAQAKVISVSLGRNILRADTAMLAALALWQGVAGDWSK